MIATRAIAVAALSLTLSGCWIVSFEDVSSDPAYRSLVGQELEAPGELLIFGVTLDQNYAKRIDVCVLTPPPGFDGPEVIVRDRLPARTAFKISGVQRCTDCLFEHRIELVLSTSAPTPCGDAPIKIDRSLLGSSVVLKPVSKGAPNNSFKPDPHQGGA